MAITLKNAVKTGLANGKLNAAETETITGTLTYGKPEGKPIARSEIKLLAQVANMDASTFEDNNKLALRQARRDLKQLAEDLSSADKAQVKMQTKYPGIKVALEPGVRTRHEEYLGYLPERRLKVTVPFEKAPADGKLAFTFGEFSVTVPVKKGMTRDDIYASVDSRLARSQGMVVWNLLESTTQTRTYLLHRFEK
jgi:hypothetical protein